MGPRGRIEPVTGKLCRGSCEPRPRCRRADGWLAAGDLAGRRESGEETKIRYRALCPVCGQRRRPLGGSRAGVGVPQRLPGRRGAASLGEGAGAVASGLCTSLRLGAGVGIGDESCWQSPRRPRPPTPTPTPRKVKNSLSGEGPFH